jgi:uncharacterized membrane protein AbrB (regulator of aidB expression)
MTATENIFLAWGLFSGGVTSLVAILILLFNATKHRRINKTDRFTAYPAARAGAALTAVTLIDQEIQRW